MERGCGIKYGKMVCILTTIQKIAKKVEMKNIPCTMIIYERRGT